MIAVNWSKFWYYDTKGLKRCNQCDCEVWYVAGGYLCTGKAVCFNEDDE